MENNEKINEAMQAVRDELMDELDYQWEKAASKACIGRSYEDGYVYFDEPDEDEFRKEFPETIVDGETLLKELKNNVAFMDALNELIQTYAEQKELPEDAGIDHEPDWEAMYNN